MQVSVRIDIIADMKPLLNVYRFAEKNQPILLEVAAKRYLQYLRRRYISQSAGGGGWEDLEDSTVDSKEARRVARNPNWILREYDLVLKSLGIKNTPKRVYVGVVNSEPHPRGNTTIEIAKVHQKGTDLIPRRVIIPKVENTIRRKMVDDVRKEYDKVIRANRRKKK